MNRSIALAMDIDADRPRVFEAVSTTAGQRAFWTADCEVSAESGVGRFGFAQAPMDLEVDVAVVEDMLVRMKVTSGFPYWVGSTFEWELGEATRSGSGTGVLFRHYGFEDGYPELDLAHTAGTWAMVLDRLSRYLTSGTPQPFFPEPAA